VHSPREAPATIVEQYRERLVGNPRYKPKYAAMLTHVDQSIGRLLDHLEARSLANNTFVVVTSDNGGSRITVQNGLRGVKATLYEGGIRVPLILRWPGRSPEGKRTVVPVIGTDLFPTLLAAAGVPSPAGQPLDGLSLLPLLRGESIQREALYWHLPSYTFASAPVAAMREGRWKLIEFFEDEHLELYDLENDPGEGRDLSSANPARRDDLYAKMRGWRESLNAPIPARRE
jgi:arylsulfatase A-like enzyme